MIPISRHLKGKRRLAVILGFVGVLVLLIGGYALWSAASWSSYHARYQKQYSDNKSVVGTALGMPAATAKERSDKLEALIAATKSLDQDTCNANVFLDWQRSISSTYKEWQKECENAGASTAVFSNQLAIVTNYLKSEHVLSASLSTALNATKSKVTEKTFSAVLSQWKATAADIKAMKVSSEFEPVKTEAQKAVDAVAAAWQALVAAHAAKNEANYEKAQKSLTEAYSGLADIEKDSAKRFTGLSETLQARYEDAF